MSSTTIRLRATLAGLALAVLAALPAAAPAADVTIGAALTLSGTNRDYGLSSKRGIDMAVREINRGGVPGVRMTVKAIDDRGTAEGAAAAFGIFFRDQVGVIMGPTLSGVALTVDHFAQGARIPVMGISNTQPGITEIGSFVFRPALTEEYVLPRVVSAVASSPAQPRTAVLIIGSDASYSATSGTVFAKALTDGGMTITKTIPVPAGTTSFEAIASEAVAADPDVMAITALPAEGIPLLKALRDAQWRGTTIGSNAFNTQEIITGAGAAANGVVVGTAWSSATATKANERFIKAFRARYRREPDQFAATAYAYSYVLAQAVRRANAGTQAAIHAQLTRMTGRNGVSTLLGRFRFDANRNGQTPVVVQVVKQRRFAIYEP